MVGDSKDVNKNGTGLGLYISKTLSTYLAPQGDKGITFQSRFGKGTNFSFALANQVYKINDVKHNHPKIMRKIKTYK